MLIRSEDSKSEPAESVVLATAEQRAGRTVAKPTNNHHVTSGGKLIKIASVLPSVMMPKRVPRSCSKLNST